MDKMLRKPLKRMGYDFVDPIYLEAGKDEFYIRDQQFGKANNFRQLTSKEIEVLVKNENLADNWSDILVSDAFDPDLVSHCHFHGKIRIGALEPYYLEFHELKLPVGLYNSTIISCDLGDNVAIKNVQYLAHYIIGDECILFNINEMQTTSHAKFGSGVLKEGEKENARVWMELCNENGRRRVLAFEDMIAADASLWAKFRDDDQLMEAFVRMTDQAFDTRRGFYGTIGNQCVIKNTQIIKDVKVGSHAYIKGANKLKNLCVKSSEATPSQLGEGVEMVNGIMGYGSRAFYGVKAVRFVLGENSTLKYGARLINSLLGDNSTISCCEVLNSLIFPGHEQHHNNSFLIAASVMGQSNIAAGATIGSNHNSRAADGEIVAGRGFWPGLSVSLKHNSKFASFCLLAKGDFPSEVNIKLPFSLVINNETDNCLDIIPAFWWLYNMYALARNTWKYEARDKRTFKYQAIESDYLAPDTVGELFQGLQLLETFTEKAYLKIASGKTLNHQEEESLGRFLLMRDPDQVNKLKIHGDGMENSKREVRLIKVAPAYQAYRKMIHYYGIKTLLDFFESSDLKDWRQLESTFTGAKRGDWFNLGGQLIRQEDLEALRQDVRRAKISSWTVLHQQYEQLKQQYVLHNTAYAFASLLELHKLKESELTSIIWDKWLQDAVAIANEIAQKTRQSREKDYLNPFRRMTFESMEEMNAVQGGLDENVFILQVKEEAERFEQRITRLLTIVSIK